MLDHLKRQSSLINLALLILIFAGGIYVLQFAWQLVSFFSDIIVILASAWVLSFILGPSVETLHQRIHLPRVWSAALVYLVFFSILTVTIISFIPAVSAQIQTLGKELPKYQHSFPQYVNKLTSIPFTLADNAISYVPSVAVFLGDIVIILILSFYLVLDKERLNRELYSLLPTKWHEHAHYVQDLIDNTFGSFIRVQVLFGIIAGFATWVIMSIGGLPFAASTSLVAGLLTIIPLIGGLLALIPPTAIAFFIDPVKALLVLLALLAMQQIIFNVIFPRVLGRALRLHPIIVLLSFLIGYKVAGGIGIIFAVPVLGVLFVIVHRLAHHFLEEI